MEHSRFAGDVVVIAMWLFVLPVISKVPAALCRSATIVSVIRGAICRVADEQRLRNTLFVGRPCYNHSRVGPETRACLSLRAHCTYSICIVRGLESQWMHGTTEGRQKTVATVLAGRIRILRATPFALSSILSSRRSVRAGGICSLTNCQ